MPRATLDVHGEVMLFDCPGCGMLHAVRVKPTTRPNAMYAKTIWEWNGSLDSPTISPSLLVRWEHGESFESRVCHSYVKDGRIQFLGDCTHELRDQTVDLKETT